MIKYIQIFILFTLFIFCNKSVEIIEDKIIDKIPHQELLKGALVNTFVNEENIVINDIYELNYYINKLQILDTIAINSIDFNSNFIILSIGKVMNNDGCKINIDKIEEFSSRIVLSIALIDINSVNRIDNQPYILYKFKKINKPLIFE